ncbi:hypothetical protein GFY24_37670 [Nocardia sp. SYP-A9097]|uniref:hypothetical protein n=1 Tax=Nocardia sp. SYP-A9097 TaxID=2663237 RepID=UPI00129AEC57|nr:hypothetical protein [Nocardia sp. SYP-A9097]MRH93087.1 hypothetical protein [Nocardia sp. SYP-A9097]
MKLHLGATLNSRLCTLLALLGAEMALIVPSAHTANPCPALIYPQALVFAATMMMLPGTRLHPAATGEDHHA